MKICIRYVTTILFVTCFYSLSYGSPTSNEFDTCRKLAVASIEVCLSERPISSDDTCWVQSKARYDSCVKDVLKTHSRSDRKKRRAVMEAAKKLEKADN